MFKRVTLMFFTGNKEVTISVKNSFENDKIGQKEVIYYRKAVNSCLKDVFGRVYGKFAVDMLLNTKTGLYLYPAVSKKFYDIFFPSDCSKGESAKSDMFVTKMKCKNYTNGQVTIVVGDSHGMLGNHIWSYVFSLAIQVRKL